MKRKVPFYSNLPDNTHCYQAGLKMVLKYFEPENEYSWEELEKLTGKVEGLWTWPQQTSIWLSRKGYEIIDIDEYDTKLFVEEGGQYLIERYGKEVGEAQIKHSDIKHEQEVQKEYLNLNLQENRIPDFTDIENLLNKGFLIGINVNSKILADKEGYSGHFVIVYEINKDNITFHDPGLPGKEAMTISLEKFEKAWAYPDEKSKNIQAFKLEKL